MSTNKPESTRSSRSSKVSRTSKPSTNKEELRSNNFGKKGFGKDDDEEKIKPHFSKSPKSKKSDKSSKNENNKVPSSRTRPSRAIKDNDTNLEMVINNEDLGKNEEISHKNSNIEKTPSSSVPVKQVSAASSESSQLIGQGSSLDQNKDTTNMLENKSIKHLEVISVKEVSGSSEEFITPRSHSNLKYGMSLDLGFPDQQGELIKENNIPIEGASTDSYHLETIGRLIKEKRELDEKINEVKKHFNDVMNTSELMRELDGLMDQPHHMQEHSIKNMKATLIKRESSSLIEDSPPSHRLSHIPIIKHSFSVEGMSKAQVKKEVLLSRAHHHGRSLEEAEEKIVSLRRPPALLEEPHEETFYELFYDLILVVVFVKLSYLKYDLSFEGILSVFAIFANFWSCWSLLNCYVTMLHTEDVLHRVYYVAHIVASFMMAVSIENPEFNFFNYRYMAYYHALASILCRCITLFMWGYAFRIDLVKTRHEHSIFDYVASDVRKQIGVHFFTLLFSILMFLSTMLIPFNYEGSDEHHWPIALLWIIAVVVEQMGTTIASVVMKLPFPAHYAGARMQAWLMLCFGESVIALLIEPIFYDSVQVGSITAAFIMILCLCTAYFDIVDADEFLGLLIVRGESKKAILYMNFQCIFSFSVFLVGVSLKTIIYVSNTLYLYEIVTGCGLGQHHEAAHRRKLNNDMIFFDHSLIGDTPLDENTKLNSEFNYNSEIDYEFELHRRLGASGSSSYTIYELDDILFKSTIMLCVSATTVMMFSILIGYSMPIGLDSFRVHTSRIGSVVVSSFTLIIPFMMKSLVTGCFKEYEADDDEFTSNTDPEGISIMKALVIISLIILVAFLVALGSVDINREATYAKIEEEAYYKQTKHHLEIHTHDIHYTGSAQASNSSNTSTPINKTTRGKEGMDCDDSSIVTIETIKRVISHKKDGSGETP